MADVVLKIQNITKSFPGVKALSDVSFEVKKASVHVLCGENGAGKSTLMKIINGVYQPDSGTICIGGQAVRINSPIYARRLGISMIFQELNYIPEMSVEESLVVGNWPRGFLHKIDWKAIREKTLQLFAKEHLSYKPTAKLKDLSVSDIQMLEILKAISYDARVIIMDEPTSALSEREVAKLFLKISELKKRGIAIIYISHRMDEIFKIADEITVLRDGKVIETQNANCFTVDSLIASMVGRKIENNFPKLTVERGNRLLQVSSFTQTGVFNDISFDLYQGEIIGFAGLMGAGRTEVMRSLFGLDRYTSGSIRIKNKDVSIKRVKDSIQNKMVMLSEDRRRYGIIPVRSVLENASLAHLKSFFYNGFCHKSKEINTVKKIFQQLNVRTPSYTTSVESLSGGNQQKVVFAKWMLCDPEILILDEPTRGIDVGAKYEIYKLMNTLAASQKGLIMVSSELPELIGLCDRIYVMAEGRITAVIERKDFSQERIMKYATKIKEV